MNFSIHNYKGPCNNFVSLIKPVGYFSFLWNFDNCGFKLIDRQSDYIGC